MLRRKYKHIPGPELNGLGYLFGHSSLISERVIKGQPFGDLLVDLHKKYGDTVKLDFGISNYVFVSTINREAIKVSLIYFMFYN